MRRPCASLQRALRRRAPLDGKSRVRPLTPASKVSDGSEKVWRSHGLACLPAPPLGRTLRLRSWAGCRTQLVGFGRREDSLTPPCLLG